MAQENPVSLEDILQFGFEQVMIEIDLTVDAKHMILRAVINQITCSIRRHHSVHSISPYSAAEATAEP